MIVEPRLAAVLFVVTAGGLLLTTSRYKSDPSSQPITLEFLDRALDDQTHGLDLDGYNYCHAQRPDVETYPDPKVKGATLVNSQVFTRHGDRTPASVLPSDLNVTWDCDNAAAYAFSGFGTEHDKAPFQYANVVVLDDITIPPESPFASTHMWKGSCLTGQLTRVGAMQHRRLGAALRQIYVDKFKLLPDTYDPESVYIRSTDFWRTKQSGENLMAGLFGVQSHSPEVSPPVLQMHILPSEIEYLTMNTVACPHIAHWKHQIQKASPVLKRLEKENAKFIKELTEILGGGKQAWSGYMDAVLPRICHAKPLQCRLTAEDGKHKCVTPATGARIMKNVNIQTAEEYRDAKGVFDILQLGFGGVARDIKQNLLKAKANGRASNMLIELWKSPQGRFYVRVIYNGQVVHTKSNWCDLEWCPLETFTGYLDKFILKDMIGMCETDQ
ncbi:hypothetical protein BGX31_009405 [Mortierella sp. GBA43]|nr:hypothetical protein BGX31_009405 [Mortierella sp. GBA43]